MGMTEEFETSLQVLRGFDTDISVEVHEIKVNCLSGENSIVFIYVSLPKTSSYNFVFHFASCRGRWHQQAEDQQYDLQNSEAKDIFFL